MVFVRLLAVGCLLGCACTGAHQRDTEVVFDRSVDALEWDRPDATNKSMGSTGFWVVKLSHDGIAGLPRVVAVRSICTYRGCTPNALLEEGTTQCPCYGSRFGFSGRVLRGPAPTALYRFAIHRDNTTGKLIIDPSRLFFFEDGGWEDPDSFVSVQPAE